MELFGAVTLFLVFYLSCLAIVSYKRKLSNNVRLPPGPTPLPLIGNFLQIKSSEILKSLLKLSERYGPVFTVYFGTKPIVVLCGHDAVKEALVDKADEFSGRATNPTLERSFEGHGVVFSEGERWKQLRRFSLGVLRDFGMGKKSIEERIQEEAQFLLEEFRKTKEKPFDPTYFLSQAVSNIICSIVFGDRFDYEDKEFRSLMEMINTLFRESSSSWAQLYDMYESFLKYFLGPPAKVYDSLENLRLFVAKKVKMNRENFDSDFQRDFIDCFLTQMEKEKNKPASEFNERNLELTIQNLFVAGTETVSSTIRYGFLYLMKHPEVQAKMHEEIDKVIGNNRVPNIEDRSQMPYMDAVIHEIQRCSDLVPMDLAHRVIRDTEFRGYLIPKGTEIYPVLSSVLHDPKMFKRPFAFDPENFLDENGRFKKNDAFVPFSSGKRICLGESLARMELFLFFTTILQNFLLKPTIPPEDIDLTPLESGLVTVPPLYQFSVIPR
ncbi:cytochrome P450 2G1-like [Anolis sagrei]|uniref:cytochrome P450 2G1-like n=1 Tax=Anolis sagrei TaxID=38937 RepID=UPI0035205B1E